MPKSSFARAKLLRFAGCCAAILAACCVTLAQAPPRPQAPVQTGMRPSFRAVSYDVTASLNPAEQMLAAKATVEFETSEPSRFIECELHPNLRITDILDANGRPVPFERDQINQLLVRVSLPDAVGTGQRVKLTFVYAGPLANEENSPARGLRLAWIGNEGAYLLLPARWFPLTNYPSNRYTGVFRIEVPQSFTVVGTGTPAPPAAAPAPASAAPPALGNANPKNLPVRALGNSNGSSGRVIYTFRTDRPEAAGTFVAGAMQLAPVKAEGLNISVYAPASASATTLRRSSRARGRNVFRYVWTAPAAQPNRGANPRRYAPELRRAWPIAGQRTGMVWRLPMRACSRI